MLQVLIQIVNSFDLSEESPKKVRVPYVHGDFKSVIDVMTKEFWALDSAEPGEGVEFKLSLEWVPDVQ